MMQNRFSGALPAGFSSLTALEVLSLSENYFTGSIPTLTAPLNHCYIQYTTDTNCFVRKCIMQLVVFV